MIKFFLLLLAMFNITKNSKFSFAILVSGKFKSHFEYETMIFYHLFIKNFIMLYLKFTVP